MATTTEIRGTIASVNERGVKLEGESEWLNYSQWAKGLPTVAHGDVVDVQIDARGFVRSIAVLDTPAPVRGGSGELPSKDIQIIRESCLKSAAQFCASRPELKSSDLFCLAERMEAWVTR